MSMRLKIWLALGAVYIIWGSTYLAIRFAVETIPPFLMVGTRFLVAGAILYGFRRLRGDAPPLRVEWKAAAVVGILLLVGGNGIVVWAEQYIPSGITALIVGTAPVFMVLIDALRPGGQRPGFKRALGILIGFAGIVILVNPSGMAQDPDRWVMIGLGALVLATFFWALGSLYNRNARLPGSPLMGTGMEMLVGGGCLLVIATLTGEWGRLDITAISARSLYGLIYLIVFGALIGFVAYTWLLRVAPTPLVSTYAYVNPLIAVLLGGWLAQEALDLRIALAAAVIVSSVFLINTGRSSSPVPKPVIVLPASGDD